MTTYGKFVAEDTLEEDLRIEDDIVICPKCGSDDVSPLHHEGNFAIPETNYNHCNECGYSWGFE